MNKKAYSFLYISACSCILFFAACGKEKNTKKKTKAPVELHVSNQKSMHEAICLAQKEKNENLEIELLEKSIKEFPESPHLATYTLRLADLYLEKDLLAQAYQMYDTFALLHPTHIYAEYASYKAIVAQFRKTLKIHRDCDSSTTEETIKLCKQFIGKTPESTHFEHVQNILTTCNERLLEKESFIFQQYIQQGKVQSAEKRLAKIKKHFSEELQDAESRILFLECMLAQAQKNDDDILKNIEILEEKYPTSPFTLMAINMANKSPFQF